MLPVEQVIADEGLEAMANGGLRLGIRLPWYRSLPLSTISVDALCVDGREIPCDAIRFELDGRHRTLAELAEATDAFWFVLDTAFLHFRDDGVSPGAAHDVALTLGVSPPYIPGMKRANTQTASLTARPTA